MPGVNRMCSRLMKLQGEKSSMQDQQTCATMRSDCPQKAGTQNKERKRNRMPSQDKQYQLMLVMKSKKNVGPALLYWQAYQQCAPNENKLEGYAYSVRAVVPGKYVKKIRHRAFGDKTESGLEGGGVIVRVK